MKNTLFLSIFICILFIIGMSACERTELQKTIVNNEPVVPREPTIECDDCPVEDCCCAVELIDGGPVSFELCGTSSPNVLTTPCSDTWGSCSISGFILPYTLTSLYDLEIFCMPLNSAFRIKSTSGSSSGTVRISCQYGQSATISEDISFPGQGFFFVDEDCIISTHCQ